MAITLFRYPHVTNLRVAWVEDQLIQATPSVHWQNVNCVLKIFTTPTSIYSYLRKVQITLYNGLHLKYVTKL